jgi:hypothetical protein
MVAEATDPISGGVGMVLALGVLALAIAWLVFPFIVIGRFNLVVRVLLELRKEIQRTNELLTRTGTEPPAAPKPTASTKSEDIPSYRI